jgi:hypothetical protein
MDAMFGTVVNVRGGVIDFGLEAHRGSVVNMSGGVLRNLVARAGSTVNVTGGMMGEMLYGDYLLAQVTLEGGSQLHLTGTEFRLEGEPVAGLEPGSSVVLQLDAKQWFDTNLEGTLADGSPLRMYIVNYTYDSAEWQHVGTLAITFTATMPGDFDGNLVVDAADYTVWRENLGGKYDADDYQNWRSNFGWRASSLQVSPPVPEPSAAAVLAMVGCAVFTQRRRSAASER